MLWEKPVLPCYPDGVCCMFAVLWRFVVIDICVLVNSAFVHKEILVDLHDRYKKNKQTEDTPVMHKSLYFTSEIQYKATGTTLNGKSLEFMTKSCPNSKNDLRPSIAVICH